MSNLDPESPKFRAKKDFDKKPGEKEQPDQEKESKKKEEEEKEEPASKPEVSSITRKNRKKLIKEKRRKRVEAQEKLNHRPDLLVFWVFISLVIIGSLVVLGYYTFYQSSQNTSQINEQETKDDTAQELEEAQIADSFFYYLAGDDQEIKLIKDYQGPSSQQEIVARFIPPSDLNNLSGSWDGGHKFAFTDNEGVQIYNSNQETKSMLAPSRGEREYYYVEFSDDEKITCLYKQNGNHFLEIYSSALKLLNKKISAQQVDWTSDNRLSYLNVDREEDQYLFMIYSSNKNKYLPYFENYFGKSRYPLKFANSKNSSKTAFLLRDNSGSKSSIVLSIGDSKDDKLVKVAELLYLDRETKDNQIIDPSIVWDSKEDYIYASINNQIFKVEISTGEIEELDLDLDGTVKAISNDSKILYIKKGNGQNDQIEKPKKALLYDQSSDEIVKQSPLAQMVDFLNYNYWDNN